MKITRKDFLRLSGLSFLAAGAAGAARAIAGRNSSDRPSSPAPVRWGMAVDLAKCKKDQGCGACIHACNAAHNVPRFSDPKHEVKWVWTEPFGTVFPFSRTGFAERSDANLPIPLMCNHCDNPPCVRVCPTQATWKREDGIVMMDWHRCIGCRYCMAACPYGSRSFNFSDPRPAIAHINPDFPTRSRGVVEKCNFCEERLAKGMSPACADACPEKALVFGNLADANSPVRQVLGTRFAIQRTPELGTGPSIYYLV